MVCRTLFLTAVLYLINECPLNGQCQTKSIVYQAEVTEKQTNTTKTYVGITENTFKSRYTAHNFSLNHRSKRHSTALSDHIWNLKDTNSEFDLKWSILAGPIDSYSTSTKQCRLCMEEKFIILENSRNPQNLNRRNELLSTCRHRRKHLLINQ